MDQPGSIEERNRIIEKHYRANFKKLTSGGGQDSQDIVQDAYVNALKWWTPAVKDFDHWMHTLIANCSRTVRLVERKRGATTGEIVIPAQRNPFHVLVLEEVIHRIEEQKHPEVLKLYFLNQYTSREVADQVKVNHFTVRSAIHEFRKIVKDLE